MTEQTIFLAALDIPDLAERTAYLDRTCGQDAGLRRQVEALLAAHDRSGFLDQPALEQMAAGRPGERPTVTVDANAPAGSDTPTIVGPDSAASPDDLGFLRAPTRADSIGRLDRYEVLEVLGRGGFGTVLRAFDDRLHRVVAIKVLAPQLATSGSARARFNREARAGAAVRDEHVVNIYEVCEPDTPVPYLVMEYVAGQTLQQKLDRTGPLSVAEILRIGSQVAKGLAAAHATGHIHRDIKPSNILLENGVERAKLTDFGLARAADDASISHSGVVAGTPQYMAPEQAHGDKIDHRADLFSLGSVLYAMSTGRPPFRASTTMAVLKRVCEEDPRPVREINPEVPDWLAAVIARLHAKKPQDRFQSAKEVAELLQQHLAHLQQPHLVPRPPAVVSPYSSPRRWQAGDRVLAPWEPEWLYPATIQQTNPNSVLVAYDDGDSGWQDAAAVQPLDIEPGARVFGWWNGPYYPGTVTARDGDRVHIAYDDGDREWTELDCIRVAAAGPVSAERAAVAGHPDQPLPAALRRLRVPADGLFVTGILYWATLPVVLVAGFAGIPADSFRPLLLSLGVVPIVAGFVFVLAAWKMKRGELYPLCVAAALLPLALAGEKLFSLARGSLTIAPGDFTALPFGIWALIELTRIDVRAAFARVRSESPLSTRPPAPRFRWAVAAAVVLVLLALGAVWFGRPALLYVSDEGELELKPEDGLASVIILQNDEGVIDDNKLHPMVTDWLGMQTARTFKLPPGKYQLNAATKSPGPRIAHWEVTTSGPLGSTRLLVPGEGSMGWSAIVTVERGRLTTVRPVVVRPVPDTKAEPVSDKERLQGAWVAESAEAEGRPLAADVVRQIGVEFAGGTARLTMPDIENGDATFKLDPTVEPKEIDVIRAGDSGGMLGIYRLDGDRLTVCMGEPRDPRPKRFDAHLDPNAKFLLVTFRRASPGEVGTVAPEIVGEDLDAKPLRLSDYRGKVVLLDFWADWCADCRQWYAHERRLAERLAGQPFAIIGVNSDRESAKANRAVQRERLEWRTLWDGQGIVSNGEYGAGVIGKAYGIRALPTYVILDHRGVVRFRQEGAAKGPTGLERAIDRLLAGLKPEAAFVRLFNGKDLTGLKADGSWKVEQGALVNESPNSRVFPTTLYGDFDCRLELNLSADAVGAFDFRAKGGLGAGLVLGKLANDPTNRTKTGSLFQTVKLNQPLSVWTAGQTVVKPDTWFVAEVRVRGGEVVVRIDGQEAVHATLTGLPSPGGIGLHVTAGKVRLRRFEIKQLSAAVPVAAVSALRNAVNATERSLDVVKARYEAGAVSLLDLTLAEVELTEARIALAEAEGDRAAVGDRLQDLVNHRQTERDLTEQLVQAGRTAPNVLHDVEARLAAAKARLAQARPVPPAGPQPVQLRSFTPGKDPLPLPQRGPASVVTAVGDAWRIENTTNAGNFNVLVAQAIDKLPKDGVLVFRAKVKVEAKGRDEARWGELGFGSAKEVYPSWDQWPEVRARYGDYITDWTEKEARYPAAEVLKRGPTVYLYAGLHANGVLWLKDVELLHLPAAPTDPPLAVAPFDEKKAKDLQNAWANSLGVDAERTNSIGMKLRLIPPGEFTLGTTEDENKAVRQRIEAWAAPYVQSESPARRVTIARAYYLGTTEVTVGQFRKFVEKTGYKTTAEKTGKGGRALAAGDRIEQKPEWTWRQGPWAADDDRPVVQVTLDDARAVCKWLSESEGFTYALPTEEQWEFACRAGTTTYWPTGNDPDGVKETDWVIGNGDSDLHRVGRRRANPFGLYDMLGNAEELCDWEKDGRQLSRGGHVNLEPWLCRSASRWAFLAGEPYYRRGFRVAIVGELKPKAPAPPRAADFKW